jgi:hypothetical protein
MNIRFLRPSLAGFLVLAAAQVASAQAVISPAYINPYSRTSLAPYINYSRGYGEYDFRNPLLNPTLVVPDFLSYYDPYRPYPGRPDAFAPNSFEEWFKQRENETRFSPSGQPIGFLIYTPYWDLPNQNAFTPAGPTRGRYR